MGRELHHVDAQGELLSDLHANTNEEIVKSLDEFRDFLSEQIQEMHFDGVLADAADAGKSKRVSASHVREQIWESAGDEAEESLTKFDKLVKEGKYDEAIEEFGYVSDQFGVTEGERLIWFEE